MSKIIICYHFTAFDSIKNIKKFIKHYKKYKAGSKHALLICFKLIDKQKVALIKKILKGTNYIHYIDPYDVNDYDFGSYKRVAEIYSKNTIFFMNSYSYPLKNNWLKKLLYHFKDKTILGTSASYESLLTSLKLKKFYKLFSYLKKFYKYQNKFKSFPNPHIRTSSFLIKGSDFLNFMKNKKILTKEDAWMAESGFNGLTNFFKNKKYNIYIVNSDGLKFTENNWKLSETYNYLKQSKSLISDKHTRKYLKLSFKKRLLTSILSWGR